MWQKFKTDNRLWFITSIKSMLCLVGTDVTFVMSPYWDQMTLYIFDECYDQLRKLMRTLLEKKYINYWYFLDFPKNTLPRLTTQILEAASPLHQLCRIISPTCTGSSRVYPGRTPDLPQSYPGRTPVVSPGIQSRVPEFAGQTSLPIPSHTTLSRSISAWKQNCIWQFLWTAHWHLFRLHIEYATCKERNLV